MTIESADSTKLKSDMATDMGEKVLRWFAQIGAAVIKRTRYFLRTNYPASDEKRAESALEAFASERLPFQCAREKSQS
jgi:hypothetical protein